MTIETVWLLVEISLSTGYVQRASPVEYRSERACLAASIGTSPIGTYGVLDQRVIVCRRVNRERGR